ncbi:MAG: hypothetical protein JSR39_05105 [Verrucomicrobia bacterium]|nr:hypothetical protein [Verrucomicrobiota bacterium]
MSSSLNFQINQQYLNTQNINTDNLNAQNLSSTISQQYNALDPSQQLNVAGSAMIVVGESLHDIATSSLVQDGIAEHAQKLGGTQGELWEQYAQSEVMEFNEEGIQLVMEGSELKNESSMMQ